jgi:hypothetical protein
MNETGLGAREREPASTKSRFHGLLRTGDSLLPSLLPQPLVPSPQRLFYGKISTEVENAAPV